MDAPIHLFHIAYSEATAKACEPGFELLDNLGNERPDWYEYWPIRRFLQTQTLDEQAFYGFFSPRLRQKTGLGAAELRAFVSGAEPSAFDAFLFSPQPDVGMLFENVFLGGDAFDAGFLRTSQDVLAAAGWSGKLTDVVMDSRTTVFSNYLVARPSFWRLWLQLCECVFVMAETPGLNAALHAQLNMQTGYGKGAQRKIFVIEGVASLLASIGGFRSRAYSPFAVPWFSIFSDHRAEAIQADALKMAYRDTREPAYLTEFRRLQSRVLASVRASHAAGTAT